MRKLADLVVLQIELLQRFETIYDRLLNPPEGEDLGASTERLEALNEEGAQIQGELVKVEKELRVSREINDCEPRSDESNPSDVAALKKALLEKNGRLLEQYKNEQESLSADLEKSRAVKQMLITRPNNPPTSLFIDYPA